MLPALLALKQLDPDTLISARKMQHGLECDGDHKVCRPQDQRWPIGF
jgi:hypothetical protein